MTLLPNPDNPREFYRPLRRLSLDAWHVAGLPAAKVKLRYLNELLSLRCTGDLLSAGLFPRTAAAKEMTESMATFQAVRHHIPWVDVRDSQTTAIVVGDGATPRTAAVLALRTRWRVHSVDPLLRARWSPKPGAFPAATNLLPYGIERLTLHPRRAETLSLSAPGDVVIVAMHSHASFEAATEIVKLAERRTEEEKRGRVAYVCVPCCTPQAVAPSRPDEVYVDEGILSPDNRVYVWHDLTRET